MEGRDCENAILRRSSILARHLHPHRLGCGGVHGIQQLHCLEYSPPEAASKKPTFDIGAMRKLMHGHNVEDREWIFNLMANSDLFITNKKAGKVYAIPDYDKPMEHQCEMTMKRIRYLLEKGVFKGWVTNTSSEHETRRHAAILECLGIYDHSLFMILNVQFYVWANTIRFLGTKRHHQKWLQDTEDYVVKGCFAMTELGHGSNVRGIETITTYDPSTKEFIITTPCESAQKYWIGGAANHGTHAAVFSQLLINGRNEGVHAFIAQIRDKEGNVCPGIRIADCGHKIGANGVDNGRIWFDNLRIPWENMLNSVADVSPDGHYQSPISNSDLRFGALMAPLTSGRVTLAVGAVYQSKIGLAIAIRYALTRRAFNLHPDEPEVLLLDYPSHQQRLLPLLAKTYAMSCAANDLKRIYWKRASSDSKTIHVLSSGCKAMFTWQNLNTLQECREACGGQGLKTENRVGHLVGEYNVQSTFEGDNNVLMQQVSKALLGEYYAANKKRRPFKGLGLEHMNNARPVIPAVLDMSTLRSVIFQVDIFRLRERDLLERFAMEISQFVSLGKSTRVALTMSYKLAEDLGRAFSQRAVLDSLLSTESKLSSSDSMKDVLGLLRTLYVLVSLEEDTSFLRYGYLTPQHSQMVIKEVGELCKELRPYALALVNSFGIPQPYLSPIAFDWVEANSYE
ncbi:hypothetical protein SUGI_0770070 [Cryptomeria japonica]|nr:hypothetical protein SUGI_0770070 [Cryptomeria japonica]